MKTEPVPAEPAQTESFSLPEEGLEITPHCLSWRSTDARFTLWDLIVGTMAMTAVYGTMMGVIALIALLLITPFVLFRGEDWSQIATGWLDGELWWVSFFISVAMAAFPLLVSFLMPRLRAFRFDAQARRLEVDWLWVGLFTQTRSWPFDAIVSIVPTITSSTDSLYVTLDAQGKSRQESLGDDFSRNSLEVQAQWLKQHLGERVKPLEESYYDG